MAQFHGLLGTQDNVGCRRFSLLSTRANVEETYSWSRMVQEMGHQNRCVNILSDVPRKGLHYYLLVVMHG